MIKGARALQGDNMRRAWWAVSGILWVLTAAAAPPPSAYGRLPAIEWLRLSPSGARYALIAASGEARKLAVFDAGTNKVLLTVPVGDVKLRGLNWAGEDHLLVTLSTTYQRQMGFVGALELFPVIDVDLKSGHSTAIFKSNRNIVPAVFGYFGWATEGGHSVGLFSGITLSKSLRSGDYYFDDGYPDLYRVDLDDGQAQLVQDAHGRLHDWALRHDGGMAAYSTYEEKAGIWRLYPGDGGDAPLLEEHSALDQISLDGLGRTSDTVLISNREGEADALEEVKIADGSRQPLLAGYSANTLFRDPESGVLLGAQTVETPGAVFFDPRQQARYLGARKAFPGLEMRLVSFSHGLDQVAVESDGGDDSGTYWTIDMRSGKATMIAAAYPQIAPADVGPTRWFKYSAEDGQQIEAVLTLPPGRKAEHLPLVVLPHGGPLDVRDRVGFDWWAQAYAGAGYAVLQPNFRGSSGYGRAFREAGFGEWGRKMQSDLSSGVHALAKQGTIDAARVCIVGGSYGGYAALAGVTLQHGLYRCAVSVGGVADLESFFEWREQGKTVDDAGTRYWRRLIAGTEPEATAAARMRAVSPAQFAAEADAPVLLIHGEDDTVVPAAQSREMERALKRADKPVQLILLKGEDHWLSREATREQMLNASVDFLRRQNPP